jgi:hypothetical protein
MARLAVTTEVLQTPVFRRGGLRAHRAAAEAVFVPTRLPAADFEPGVPSPYGQLLSYTVLFSWNSVLFPRPLSRGVLSYTSLYRALRCKRPPVRFRP